MCMHFPQGTRPHLKVSFEEDGDGNLQRATYEFGWILPNGKFVASNINSSSRTFIHIDGGLMDIEEAEARTEPYT